MTKEEIYSIWAPEGNEWSRWVKPVLFAYLSIAPPEVVDREPEGLTRSFPPPQAGTILVADLPGAQTVQVGLKLARKGYRPIPLFNACPQPRLPPLPRGLIEEIYYVVLEGTPRHEVRPAVDVMPLLSVLYYATNELKDLNLQWHSPPLFLLDSRRNGEGKRVDVGMFDNRSATFPSDFPSAATLKDRGIRSVVVILEGGKPQFDLANVLREWEEGGLGIKYQTVGLLWDPKPLTLPNPSRLRMLWFWLQTRLGLHQNASGGYGAMKRGSGG